MTDYELKLRENTVRRMAHRQRLRLVKSRRRDPNALDYGLYALIMVDNGGAVNPALVDHFTCSWSLDQIEHYLTQPEASASSKRTGARL